ncbi:MAG: SpoIIE family protein phosphatase [Sporichthyaceae bacterium]
MSTESAAPVDPPSGSLLTPLLHAACEQFPTGLLLFDVGLRYVLVNAQMASMANTPAADLIGRSVHDVFPDYSALTERIEQVLATGEPLLDFDVRGTVPGEEGVQHDWSLSAYRLTGPDGTVLGVALTSTEVTALRSMERDRAAMAQRLGLLARVGDLLSGGLDTGATVDNVLRLVVPDIATWAAVHLVDQDDGRIMLAAARHTDPMQQPVLDQVLGSFQVTADQPYGAGHVIATGAAEQIPEVADPMLVELAEGSDDALADLRTLEVTSGISIPLSAAGVTFGALSCSLPEPGGTPGSAERDQLLAAQRALLDDVAARAALALENARLYARQHEVAVTLQRSLLPQRLPDLPGTELAARYLPGAAGTEVGGDFYEALVRDDGLLVLAIGDVMGHGVHAAAVMGQVRAALRAYALEGHGPAGVLRGLAMTLAAVEEPSIVTCLVVLLDLDTGGAELASAGHLPPVLAGYGGCELVTLEPGPPLGVPDGEYATTQALLPPGGTLVLFTDGLVEARDQPVGDGLATLCDIVRHAARGGASVSASEVADQAVAGMGRVDEQGRTDATADDVAILVAHRIGQ